LKSSDYKRAPCLDRRWRRCAVWSREGDELLILCPKHVEQLKLPVAREQLVIPLHMKEDRHLNGGRILFEALGHID
jgi:hypothetical protein